MIGDGCADHEPPCLRHGPPPDRPSAILNARRVADVSLPWLLLLLLLLLSCVSTWVDDSLSASGKLRVQYRGEWTLDCRKAHTHHHKCKARATGRGEMRYQPRGGLPEMTVHGQTSSDRRELLRAECSTGRSRCRMRRALSGRLIVNSCVLLCLRLV